MIADTTVRELLEARRQDLEQIHAAAKREVESWQTSPSEELASHDQHPADMATDLVEREKAFSVLDLANAALHELEDAFRALEDGTYGRCAVCNQPIPDARLLARPEARHCLEHAPQTEA